MEYSLYDLLHQHKYSAVVKAIQHNPTVKINMPSVKLEGEGTQIYKALIFEIKFLKSRIHVSLLYAQFS